MKFYRKGSQTPFSGPADWFTGTVSVQPLFPQNEPSRMTGGHPHFQPGARTAWHTHPVGQVIIVTSGKGRVQRWGGPIEVINEGDVVFFEPGEKHWHGAAPDSAMSHIALQENVDGKNVDWLEHVTDEQYSGASPSAER